MYYHHDDQSKTWSLKKNKGNIYEELQDKWSKSNTRSYQFFPSKYHKYYIKETAMVTRADKDGTAEQKFQQNFERKQAELVHG